jgi:hypothetical protein
MRRLLLTTKACVALFFVLASVSCGGQRLTGKEDTCITRYVKEDIRDNPKLKKISDPVVVEKVENGYVNLAVLGVNPFSYQAVDAIKRGEKIIDVEKSIDPSVAVLVETEDIIKKIPGVKAVAWTAYQKVTSMSSAGARSGPMTAGESGVGCPNR